MNTNPRREDGGRQNEPRRDDSREDYYGAYPEESRFRDRRGREHYDDGRYAPMGGGYDYPQYIGPYEPPYYKNPREGERTMNKIGFSMGGEVERLPDGFHPEYHSTMNHPSMDEMSYRKGERLTGYGEAQPRLTRNAAMEWADSMENEDGTRGAHWPIEQTKQVQAQKGIDCEPLQFWIAMNMIYSDYVKVAKKLGMNNVDFYACMAEAFLDDKDAQPDKLARYYEYVVKH